MTDYDEGQPGVSVGGPQGPQDTYDAFEEPDRKVNHDFTGRCAPDGIDPGDELYCGRPVRVDFRTGAVEIIDAEAAPAPQGPPADPLPPAYPGLGADG